MAIVVVTMQFSIDLDDQTLFEYKDGDITARNEVAIGIQDAISDMRENEVVNHIIDFEEVIS